MTFSKPSQVRLQLNNEPTLTGLVRALLAGSVNAVRQNKLAATLAGSSFVFTAFLAYAIQYNEVPRYRQEILPAIQKVERNVFVTLDNAQNAPNDLWRLHYFLTAHYRVRDALRVARSHHPATSEGLAAHHKLIRYYELVSEEMAILRTQMSVADDFDYWSEWEQRRARLEPLHREWAQWVAGE